MKQQKNTNRKQFDLRTHPRDAKGQIGQENHYRLVIDNGEKRFERPPGSGWIYTEADDLISKPKDKPVESVQPDESGVYSKALVHGLESQVNELKAKLQALEEAGSVESVQASALTDVSDIPVSADVDLSEEIELMKQAGVDPESVIPKESLVKKSLFNKPNFLKG